MENELNRSLLVDIYCNGLMVDQGGKINDDFRHLTVLMRRSFYKIK